MKKLFFTAILISALAIFIVGCGNADNKNGQEKTAMDPLEVELNVQEKAKVNETIQLSSLVTQGKEKVSDASEVKYEVWEDGAKDTTSKMLNAKNKKNGTYTSEVAFDHDGVFNVQVHVTARDMHVMPKKTVIVGSPDPSNATSSTDKKEHDSENSVVMHFMSPDHAKAGEAANFTIHMTKHNELLTGAQVQIEAWMKGDEKPEWIKLEDAGKGEYKGTHQFDRAGDYQLKVHVENNQGLHEHQDFDFVVK